MQAANHLFRTVQCSRWRLANHIRYSSSGLANQTKQLGDTTTTGNGNPVSSSGGNLIFDKGNAPDVVSQLTQTPIPLETSAKLTFQITDLMSKPVLTGAIIPFSQLNYFQQAFYPLTFSVMYFMDFLIGYMPWWAAICTTTLALKVAFFPLMVKLNVVGIKLHNIMPETQKVQAKINEAMCSGDSYNTALNQTKLKLLYKDNNVSIMQRLWPSLIQAPVFMSMFFLLRGVSTYPVESLTTGGALWFSNLTVADPFYILPLITSASMYAMIHYGMEGSSGPVSTMQPAQRWFLRAMPIGLFAFIYSFPSAVLLYWATNNVLTLTISLILKHSWVKTKLNIPDRIKHDPVSLPLMNQSFSTQMKTAIDQGRARRTTLDVRRLDDIAFKKAGVGPLRKTYKTPPT